MTRHLFVYGTLRPDFDGPMAKRLKSESRHIGPAHVRGRLHCIADYPGLIMAGDGWVHGDLMLMADAGATLAWIDAYEECALHFPEPHEYRRKVALVEGGMGDVRAWTYIYALPVTGLPIVAGGDFLTCAQGCGG